MKNKLLAFTLIISAVIFSGCSLFPSNEGWRTSPLMPVPRTTSAPITAPTANTSETPQNVTPETPVSSDQPPVQAALTENIEMRNYSFNPATVTINRGTTVIWTNFDSALHDVVADNKSFSSSLFGQGQSYSFTFTTIGTYTYYCSAHPRMKGTIIIK